MRVGTQRPRHTHARLCARIVTTAIGEINARAATAGCNEAWGGRVGKPEADRAGARRRDELLIVMTSSMSSFDFRGRAAI